MANSYIDVATANTYHVDNGQGTRWDASASDATKQTALQVATTELDRQFGARWKGCRVSSTQDLDWPRLGVYDYDNALLSSTTIPEQVGHATAQLALSYVELVENGTQTELWPDQAEPGEVRRHRRKVDVLEDDIEYVGGRTSQRRFVAVGRILHELLKPGGRMNIA